MVQTNFEIFFVWGENKNMFLDPSMQEMQFKFEYMTEQVLDRIVEYMNHHENKEPPIIESPLQGDTMAAHCKV